MAHRPPHDLAQHVAAPFVARQHAVSDEERHRAQVIGDDSRRDRPGVHRRREHAGRCRPAVRRLDGDQQRLERVRVVVRQRALHDRRDALEAHPGVDRRLGERLERPVRLPVELHEDVVPDLDVAIAVARRTETRGRGAGEIVAAEVVNLRAAAAGPGIAHRPEVVRRAELVDAIRRHEIPPSVERVVVARDAVLALEDRREQTVRRQAPLLRQQLPGQRDRVVLEVVAEREVAEHLEERVVPERRPDVVEVVVLAADAHALLRRRRARVGAALPSEEHVLELVHPGVGEEQRRVAVRHQRGARDDAVAVSFEVAKERRAELGRGHNP